MKASAVGALFHVFFLAGQMAWASIPLADGKVFSAPERSKQVFRWELMQINHPKTQVYKSIWSHSSKGPKALVETTTATGPRLIKYEVEDFGKRSLGSVEIVGNEVHFSLTTSGKTQTAKEKLTPEFMVPSMIPLFIRDHFEELDRGQLFQLRLAILERRETIAFTLRKSDLKSRSSKVDFEMVATNPVIQIFAPRLVFHVDRSKRRIIGYEGPSAPNPNLKVVAEYRYFPAAGRAQRK